MKRIYLVVVDETAEAEVALRFAARRASKTGGGVHILALVPPTGFVQWGDVQATIEAEARQRAETLVAAAAGTLIEEAGVRPEITVMVGEPVEVVRDMLGQVEGVGALVLGAAAAGAPGPLVSHFAGANAGALPCPIMIIPGSLSAEDLERLS